MTKTLSISRLRHSFSGWLAAVFLCLLAPVATAQELFPVLTIDLDRLFSETRLGVEKLEGLERGAQALAAENADIENALIETERELTEQRASLEPEEFRALADEFDKRVQRLRQEQDEKARALNRTRDEARTAFFQEVQEVIAGIVREKGALVVIDRRDVFLSADKIDITEEAIERVNAAEGRD